MRIVTEPKCGIKHIAMLSAPYTVCGTDASLWPAENTIMGVAQFNADAKACMQCMQSIAKHRW